MPDAPATHAWPVAVFAHNEETRLLDCLDSLDQPGARLFVLVNGSTDRTEAIARDYARTRPHLEVVSLALGDKARTWNVFVHEVVPEAEVVYFVDGDIHVLPGACAALAATLRAHPEATAAAAVPMSGRSREAMTRLVTDARLLMGGLYALRGSFVTTLKSAGTKMPVGYIGDDGWVTSMAKWNGDPRNDWREDRVAPCLEAGYTFRSFSPWRRDDRRKYLRRRVRYSMRHFQHLLWRDTLLSGGLAAVPAHVSGLYSLPGAEQHLRPRLSEFPFDWLALREMHRQR
jgi:glycosyltransferase involved in cell wall biosynthesis